MQHIKRIIRNSNIVFVFFRRLSRIMSELRIYETDMYLKHDSCARFVTLPCFMHIIISQYDTVI